jgi:hypothetical protein
VTDQENQHNLPKGDGLQWTPLREPRKYTPFTGTNLQSTLLREPPTRDHFRGHPAGDPLQGTPSRRPTPFDHFHLSLSMGLPKGDTTVWTRTRDPLHGTSFKGPPAKDSLYGTT